MNKKLFHGLIIVAFFATQTSLLCALLGHGNEGMMMKNFHEGLWQSCSNDTGCQKHGEYDLTINIKL